MKWPFLFCLLTFCTCNTVIAATDIVTLSGKKYLNVHDVQIRGGMLTFTTESDIVKVPLSDVPPALKERYQPKATPIIPEAVVPPPSEVSPATATTSSAGTTPTSAHDLVVNTANRYLSQMAADLESARTSAPTIYAATDAFSIGQLDEARKDALMNGRPVAFFMVDESLLTGACIASEGNAKGALAHFVQTFSRSVTPVFIFQQRDLAKLPGVLSVALGKPASVAAPRVIFTNSEITETLADLTLNSEKQTFAQRNEAIYPAVGMIKRWYVKIANSVP